MSTLNCCQRKKTFEFVPGRQFRSESKQETRRWSSVGHIIRERPTLLDRYSSVVMDVRQHTRKYWKKEPFKVLPCTTNQKAHSINNWPINSTPLSPIKHWRRKKKRQSCIYHSHDTANISLLFSISSCLRLPPSFLPLEYDILHSRLFWYTYKYMWHVHMTYTALHRRMLST